MRRDVGHNAVVADRKIRLPNSGGFDMDEINVIEERGVKDEVTGQPALLADIVTETTASTAGAQR